MTRADLLFATLLATADGAPLAERGLDDVFRVPPLPGRVGPNKCYARLFPATEAAVLPSALATLPLVIE
jgi:hypothetical protein